MVSSGTQEECLGHDGVDVRQKELLQIRDKETFCAHQQVLAKRNSICRAAAEQRHHNANQGSIELGNNMREHSDEISKNIQRFDLIFKKIKLDDNNNNKKNR